jgi:hypothetical protein
MVSHDERVVGFAAQLYRLENGVLTPVRTATGAGRHQRAAARA